MEQSWAIATFLELRDDISLADGRRTVPQIARLAERHPRLNLMNLEAVASARVLGATVWPSPPAARGVLAEVLDAENVGWVVRPL